MKEIQQQEFAKITAEHLKEKYNHLSDDDIKWITSSGKEFKTGSIGRNKYHFLIEKRNSYNLYNQKYPNSEKMELTDLENQQISKYEEEFTYLKENLNSKNPNIIDFIDGIEVTKSNLYHGFLQSFKYLNGYDFKATPETIKNLEVILKYFIKDIEFYKCENLLKIIDGVELAPSFDKGLLIVGNYGNGKSTIIKCFENLFNHNYKIAYEKHWKNISDWAYLRFKIVSCHEIISEFESLPNPNEKDFFNKKYSELRDCFDDIKKEKRASNFGLTNVKQTILEKRYDKKSKTYLTMNFNDDYPNDTSKALEELGIKYGNHVYDRVFEMFNIIEFKGKSFRK